MYVSSSKVHVYQCVDYRFSTMIGAPRILHFWTQKRALGFLADLRLTITACPIKLKLSDSYLVATRYIKLASS